MVLLVFVVEFVLVFVLVVEVEELVEFLGLVLLFRYKFQEFFQSPFVLPQKQFAAAVVPAVEVMLLQVQP